MWRQRPRSTDRGSGLRQTARGKRLAAAARGKRIAANGSRQTARGKRTAAAARGKRIAANGSRQTDRGSGLRETDRSDRSMATIASSTWRCVIDGPWSSTPSIMTPSMTTALPTPRVDPWSLTPWSLSPWSLAVVDVNDETTRTMARCVADRVASAYARDQAFANGTECDGIRLGVLPSSLLPGNSTARFEQRCAPVCVRMCTIREGSRRATAR